MYVVALPDLLLFEEVRDSFGFGRLYSVAGCKIQLVKSSLYLHIELFDFSGNRVGRHKLDTADNPLEGHIFIDGLCYGNL